MHSEKRTSKQRNDLFNFVGWGDKDRDPSPLMRKQCGKDQKPALLYF
jgi:hypothetical protein